MAHLQTGPQNGQLALGLFQAAFSTVLFIILLPVPLEMPWKVWPLEEGVILGSSSNLFGEAEPIVQMRMK